MVLREAGAIRRARQAHLGRGGWAKCVQLLQKSACFLRQPAPRAYKPRNRATVEGRQESEEKVEAGEFPELPGHLDPAKDDDPRARARTRTEPLLKKRRAATCV
jgi:hypothetical protein